MGAVLCAGPVLSVVVGAFPLGSVSLFPAGLGLGVNGNVLLYKVAICKIKHCWREGHLPTIILLTRRLPREL